MRVLLISHTCQSRTEGQPKARLLAATPGIDLRVLVPARWKHYGQWRAAEPPMPTEFTADIRPARFAWVGPAQNYLHYYPTLAALLREFRPDVIDLWEEPWGAVSAHAVWLRDRLLPGSVVISETEQNIDKRLPPPFEQFRGYVLARADAVVARNAEAVEVVRRKGYTGPAHVVPNAVDAELFRPLDRAACRAACGFVRFTSVYIGRLVPEKGLDDLVDAAALAPDVDVRFIGDGPHAAELTARITAAGLTDRVKILPGRPLTALPELMNAADVLVLPSRTTPRWKEQFGRVVIEAHACATPVIGTTSGAIPEVVGDAGLLIPERNPPALAQALTTLANDPPRARHLGHLGHTKVHTTYTWQRVATQMATLYTTTKRRPH